MREKDIQAAALKGLINSPLVAWAYITTVGTVKGVHGGRPFRVGFNGQSDIMGQMSDGRLLAIEVKVPGKAPTDDQLKFISTVIESNGVAGWCDSANGALEIIRAFTAKKDIA